MYLEKITEKNLVYYARMIEEDCLRPPLLPGAGCISDDGDEIGAVIVDTDGFGLVIRSLYVDPLYRDQGAGSLLLKGVYDMAQVAGASSVDAFFYDTDFGIEDFFLNNGFLVTKGYPVFSFSLKKMLSRQNFEGLGEEKSRCVPLKDLNENGMKMLQNMITQADYPGIDVSAHDELSFVYIDEKDRITACLLAGPVDKDTVRVELILNPSQERNGSIRELIFSLLRAVKEDFSEKASLEFVCANEKVLALLKKYARNPDELRPKCFVCHASRAVE